VEVFFVFCFGFFTSSILLAVVQHFFPKWNLVDSPENYGHKRGKLPYPAGSAVVISFFLGAILFFSFSEKVIAFLVGGLLLAIISFLDDRKRISPFFRLGIQLGISIGLVSMGISIGFITNPFGYSDIALGSFLASVVTIVWILLMINAANWLDGVSNLVPSATAVSAGVLGLLSLSDRVHQPEVAVMCFLLLATVLPYVLWNATKQRMVLGDTGSMFFGYCIAIFSIIAGGKVATAMIVMAIPLYDAIYVTVSRLLEKKSPFRGGDKRHLHDVLLKNNWKEWQILVFFVVISGGMGILTLFLDTLGKVLLILGSAFCFLCFRFFLTKLQFWRRI
jgi:UDP-GlcNAc:undecaprenyl-phosphate/decaprenyl-phosphate GlcNAc-1-phosphate transferase